MILRRKIQLGAFVIFVHALVLSVLGNKFHGCQTKSSQGYYICNGIFRGSCSTYAVLRANSDTYSSLSNLSSLLNISPSVIAQANGGFSLAGPTAVVFSIGQPILIPINCNCNANNNGGFFEAQVTRTTVEGESFDGIARSFEGLTTCQGIHRRNPSISSAKNLNGGIGLSIPLKCACPLSSISSDEFNKNLVSYPVKQGDTLAQLALQFNVTTQAIVSANNLHSKGGFNLINNATLLIPVQGKPNIIGFFSPKPQPQNPSFRQPPPTIQPQISHKKKTHKKNFGVVLAFIVIVLLIISTSIFSAIVYFCIKYWKKKRHDSIKKENWDQLKGLSLSVRTSTDKKLEDPNMLIGNFSYEDLQMATDNFGSSNLIEGSVFHGRLNGKNMAIKRTPSHFVSRIDFRLFNEMIHQNIIRVLGTCVLDGPDSFVVFEYAENGSLKDWIHGGLAIKSQFISSCNCFLKFKQRLKICLNVATALYYMHFVTKPSYVHRNIRSRNIFLDENFNAKLGNFGMANCVEHVYEDQELCNKGYLAPEYVGEGIISPSIDVFAYGVVLLEVLSGKPAVRRGEGSLVIKLCDEIKRVLKSEEELKAWFDNAFLGEEYSFERGVVVAKLAVACVEDEPSLRPDAGEIVDQMLRLVEELPEDDRFSFFK
ncbi:hypothetical protein ABFS82_06G007900 [Erythranthe guttata]|uniref:protein LYK2-like n=1 Tax=Erythranthe guttata TaxID=4155 RepID=UPI00064DB02F|nr:PREDICTED: protein LYK2-like [Erythranthe guttata]|eukprot:XP_012844196.1 PREDICTED: protein LYK2-like [Erythranthe guttata]